jgi:hypothetical protein
MIRKEILIKSIFTMFFAGIFVLGVNATTAFGYDYSGYDYSSGYDYGGSDYSGYDYGGYDYGG